MQYGENELRKMYLDFFSEKKGHLKMKSFSLVPHNDNSLLLINAGMAPLKPYFTGQEIPPRRRVTTCQKCVRTGDIENVGKTERHLTFFEMLGNFSFGDYFKTEAIHWSWEFLTEVLKLDPERLYVTIYIDDDEAFNIWHDEVGVPAEKIMRIGRDADGSSDNFWEHGAGPCGPCTEIYYDRGPKYGTGPEDVMGGEGDRFMEIWNNVFTQFEGDGHGGYTELSQKNIDTGMGLERLAVVMQDVESVFDIDTMVAIRNKICEFAGKKYKENEEDDISIRLITDHIRSATFMISDGILPSNEGRGYVLRRLIRRAARHGRMLGIKGTFLNRLTDVVIDCAKDGYPELLEKKSFIKKVLEEEEERFLKTIDQGLEILGGMEDELKKEGKTCLSGENAFKLYDTYGFPVDLTAEIIGEKGFTYDEDGFKNCMEEQRKKARLARKETNYMGVDASVYQEIDPRITSLFTGYDRLSDKSEIRVITTESEIVEGLTDGERGTIITDRTPFYGTMGGQNGDSGIIEGEEGSFKVETTIHLLGGKIGHVGVMTNGKMRTGEKVTLSVDKEKRQLISNNHSATHLLQGALRKVLGDHVQQKGSLVTENRLRFDFTHFQAMTSEELKETEDIVNKAINEAIPVVTTVMTLDEAKKTGAMALFGEKYGDKVRVVKMGDYSTELCGGTHVDNTASIKAFKIVSESGISAGVRRIEALTSKALFEYFEKEEERLKETSLLLKTTPDEVTNRIESLLKELKTLKSENESLKQKVANDSLGNVMDHVKETDGIKYICAKVEDQDMGALRKLGDSLKDKLGSGVVVLASDKDGKASLIVMAGDDAVKKGVNAGSVIKMSASFIGGGGGGRPNMAQAGGKDPSGIDQALIKAEEVLLEQLK
jgi:alanyl-tRNA synthetase